MSMRSYGFEDYGLLLSEETLNMIAKKACRDYDDKTYYTTYDLVDLIEENDKVPFAIDYVSEFSGSAFELDTDGYDLDTDKNYD